MNLRLLAALLLSCSCQLLVKFEPPPEGNAQCDDDLDNDDDGDIDCGDADCVSSAACGAPRCGNGRVDPPSFGFVEGPGIAVAGGPLALAAARINSDVIGDVVVGTGADLRELRGGNNTLTLQPGLNVTGLVGIAAGRFDAGDTDDIAMLVGDTARQVVPVLNDAGTLRAGRGAPLGDGPISMIAGNFNGQPGDDVLVGATESLVYFTSNGAGMFNAGVFPQTPAAPRFLAAGDHDGDGDLDVLAIARLRSQAYLFDNTGGGATLPHPFTAGPVFGIGADASAVVFADLGGDRLDAIFLEETSMRARVLRIGAERTLTAGASLQLSGIPASLVATDLDLDGDVDLAVGLRSGSILLFAGDGAGAFTAAGNLNAAGADAMIAVPVDAVRGSELVVAERAANRVRIFSNTSSFEECDDGNLELGDDCNPDCTVP